MQMVTTSAINVIPDIKVKVIREFKLFCRIRMNRDDTISKEVDTSLYGVLNSSVIIDFGT